jgi:micrococcal nuclease
LPEWTLYVAVKDTRYIDALSDAQKNKLGIWANENNVAPWDYRKKEKHGQ